MERSHTLLAKIIHWGFIILYVYGIFKQIDDLSQLEDRALLTFEVIFRWRNCRRGLGQDHARTQGNGQNPPVNG